MRLSTRTRYAARAMVDLAAHQGEQPVHLAAVGRRLGVSQKYLEQLLAALQAAGLVRTVRGRRGGYSLALPAAEITIWQVYEASEGGEAIAPCDGAERCERADDCVLRGVWSDMSAAMKGVLDSVTLADLAERAARSADRAGEMYVI